MLLRFVGIDKRFADHLRPVLGHMPNVRLQTGKVEDITPRADLAFVSPS